MKHFASIVRHDADSSDAGIHTKTHSRRADEDFLKHFAMRTHAK
jgi:hypothetical protein